jgi:hypothetical protein
MLHMHTYPCHRTLYCCCVLQAILNAATADGHKAGVHSLFLIGQHLFSGDRQGVLKVRQMSTAYRQVVLRAPGSVQPDCRTTEWFAQAQHEAPDDVSCPQVLQGCVKQAIHTGHKCSRTKHSLPVCKAGAPPARFVG